MTIDARTPISSVPQGRMLLPSFATQAQKQALRAQLDVATDAQERTRESLKQLKTGTRFTRGGAWAV